MSRELVMEISTLKDESTNEYDTKEIGVRLKNVVGYKKESQKYVNNLTTTLNEEKQTRKYNFRNNVDNTLFSFTSDTAIKEDSIELITSGAVYKEVADIYQYLSEGADGDLNIPDSSRKIYVNGTPNSKENVGHQYFDPDIYIGEVPGELFAKIFDGALRGNADTATKFLNAMRIAIDGAAKAEAKELDGTTDVTLEVTELDATKVKGVLPLNTIPPKALERIHYFDDSEDLEKEDNDTTRAIYSLTIDDVQNGDTAKGKVSGRMFLVVDDTKLDSPEGYEEYTAGLATAATKLETARTINDVSFNGTEDITIVADPKNNLLTDENLNDITKSGSYYALGNNTCTSKPDGCTSNFGMRVYNIGSGLDYVVCQVVFWNSEIAFRILNVTDWSILYGTKHIPTHLELGLDQVDNTSDADKPISNAEQEELDIINRRFDADELIIDDHEERVSNIEAVTVEVTGAAKAAAKSIDGAVSKVELEVTELVADNLTGTIPMSVIPPKAIQNIYYFDDSNDVDKEDDDLTRALFKLTTEEVQNGDTAKGKASGRMFLVVDDSKLYLPEGYEEYTAGLATAASKLEVGRKINGVVFNGERDIEVLANPKSNVLTSENLFDITTPGSYYAGNINSCGNKPEDCEGNFVLRVFSAGSTSDGETSSTLQIIYYDNRIQFRVIPDAWTEIYSRNIRPTLDELGIGNIDNTSDEDKPISKAAQEVLDAINKTLEEYGEKIESTSDKLDETSENTNKLQDMDISITGGATASSISLDGTVSNIALEVTELDATKVRGVLSIDNIPPKALERIRYVNNDEERFKLTTDEVQNGDTVKVGTDKMYLVVDDEKLDSEEGYEVYSAGIASMATVLEHARKINGVEFDGSKDIEITSNPTLIELVDENLDDLTTTGVYYSKYKSTCTNTPYFAFDYDTDSGNYIGYNPAFTLIVTEYIHTDGTIGCTQLCISNARPDGSTNTNDETIMYYRFIIGTSVGKWTKVYDDKNKPSKSDVGLGNVDNTSDNDKPISAATSQALADLTTQVEALNTRVTNNDTTVSQSLSSVDVLTSDPEDPAVGYCWINVNG